MISQRDYSGPEMNKDILLYHKSLNFIDKTNYNYSNNKLKNNFFINRRKLKKKLFSK
jgi:Fe-S cluster assembly iron-binding protein IscA